MDKVLILGGTGMIGHALFHCLTVSSEFDVYTTVRHRKDLRTLPVKQENKVLDGVDVSNMDRLTEILSALRPATVINCVGLTKRLPSSGNLTAAIFMNSLYPHRLAALCQAMGIRLVHFSTDCVFSGQQGNYIEQAVPDATDTYGRTKALGEVTGAGCLTLRSSMIGHELKQKTELLEWFLAQRGPVVNGFRRAIFSGITTLEMARVLADFVLPNPALTGLYHVSSVPIAKFDLLTQISRRYGRDVTLAPVDEPVLDRSLDSSAFRQLTGYLPPSWEEMLSVLHEARQRSPWYAE